MTFQAALTVALGIAAGAFFLAGTLGLLRFPDLHSRLHALTKADNVGLGLLVAALAVHSASLHVTAKLVLVWLLALLASSCASYALAGGVLRRSRGPRGDA